MRWREELAHGRDGDEAIVRAMETAGRAVVFCGTTVAIGLLALVALPLPFLRVGRLRRDADPARSASLVALTLLPVVLHSLGPQARLAAPAHRRQGARALDALGAAASCATAGSRPAGAILVLAALVLAATNMQLGLSNADTIAKSGDAKDGLVALEQSGIGSGALTPLRGPRARRLARRGGRRGRRASTAIHGAVAPPTPPGARDGTAHRRRLPDARRLDAGQAAT